MYLLDIALFWVWLKWFGLWFYWFWNVDISSGFDGFVYYFYLLEFSYVVVYLIVCTLLCYLFTLVNLICFCACVFVLFARGWIAVDFGVLCDLIILANMDGVFDCGFYIVSLLWYLFGILVFCLFCWWFWLVCFVCDVMLLCLCSCLGLLALLFDLSTL